ncbi:MAG: DUF3604 domain-containing protein [Myxococcota bacterium]
MGAGRLLVLACAVIGASCRDHEPPPQGRTTCELAGDPSEPEPVILFGDLHAHTSTSLDVTLLSLPLLDTRPYGPDDACHFARYCAQLDFWSINDHAEEMLPEHWQQNLDAVRSCNDQFDGYRHDPEMVTYLGWEWTQSTNDPATDYGHHNVVLKDTCEGSFPERPFAAPASFAGIDPSIIPVLRDLVVSLDPDNASVYDAAVERVEAFEGKPACDPAADTLELPPDCHEVANAPADLYGLFERWGLDVLAIPHGTAWGTHHAQQVSWRQRFDPAQLSPRWSPLVEVHSGHGNSEEYRPYRHAEEVAGELECPAPTEDFEACCWRAGEITRERSDACQADPTGAACLEEVEAARQTFLAEGKRGFQTLPDATADDWLECGQCVDCFQPALNLRPERTAQAALAMTNFDAPNDPWRYVFGFVSSTDTHQTGPGAGYKEFQEMSDATGASDPRFEDIVDTALAQITPDHTRQESFNFAGGLVAVHAEGRDRDAIWNALESRRVYATSGERMELWFDRVGSGGERQPMGAQVVTTEVPEFEVRARGSFVQAPGCPDWVHDATSPEFIERMCFGECYNPTDQRHRITAIEVIKVTPQTAPDESIDPLIQDPYRVLPCDGAGDECTVTFRDEAYATEGRPASYYVRALQEPTAIFNQGTLRCERDDMGRCIDTNPCDVGPGSADDCLEEGQERAWSSPIYLYPDPSRVPEAPAGATAGFVRPIAE